MGEMKMTLYDLTNETTLQGDVCIKVFDQDGNEKESRFFRDQCEFICYCNDVDDLENLEVSFIYPHKSPDGAAWLVIELTE